MLKPQLREISQYHWHCQLVFWCIQGKTLHHILCCLLRNHRIQVIYRHTNPACTPGTGIYHDEECFLRSLSAKRFYGNDRKCLHF
nr:MAG TPA_asm: hypothetical protein [Caudoviricetes sp.]